MASVTLSRGSSFGILFAGFDDGFHATVERGSKAVQGDRSELLDRLVAGYRLSDKLLVTARVLGLPCALLQSLDERVRSRSGLGPPSLLVGVRRLLLSKKLSRIPEVHVESLDFFNEHQDGAAGRSDLFAPVVRQAFAPAAERVEFLLIKH